MGSQLLQIHLLESEVVEKYITQYSKDGNNMVEKVTFVKVPNQDCKELLKIKKSIIFTFLYINNIYRKWKIK